MKCDFKKYGEVVYHNVNIESKKRNAVVQALSTEDSEKNAYTFRTSMVYSKHVSKLLSIFIIVFAASLMSSKDFLHPIVESNVRKEEGIYVENIYPFISNDKKVESSCRRVCSGRPIKNKIYWAYGQAGLDDRKTIIHNLAQIAGFLCAEVVLPPPSRLLSPFHNNGMLIDDQLEWSDFSNLTFASDNQPVIKSGRDEFGQHFEDWHQFPLFDTVSETSKYQHWFHVVSKENDWKTDFQSILDYTYLQEEHHGFVWELKGSLYEADLFEDRLKGPSQHIAETYSDLIGNWKKVYRPRMRPFLLQHCLINGLNKEECKGCIYTKDNDADPSHLKMLKKRLEKRIHTQALDNTYLGHLHIRRGDVVQQCDTSINRMKEYFKCSLNETENLDHNITLLMTSDETDVSYREELMALVNESGEYPHVTILDVDKMVKSVMRNAIRSGLLKERLMNNYIVFAAEELLRDWTSSFVDFRLLRRRGRCKDCIHIKNRVSDVPKNRLSL